MMSESTNTKQTSTGNVYFDTIYTGGNTSGDNVARVHLYPFSTVEATCKAGGNVAVAIRGSFEDLLDYESIEGYKINCFNIDTWTPPDNKIDLDFGDDAYSLKDDFEYYLNIEATSPNTGVLLAYDGAHQLIHPNQNACDETSEGYAPEGAGGEGSGDDDSAFNTGLMAWSPVCNSNDSLTKAAAVQECLHMHIAHNRDDQWTDTNDNQHTLGTVMDYVTYTAVTPLLTYHWDDDLGGGECAPMTGEIPDTYLVSPTYCTKEAIKNTANHS